MPDTPNPGEPMELHIACAYGDTAGLKAWLEAGGDPNATVYGGFPAWWGAIVEGEEGAVQQIVDCEGTDLELKSTALITKDHTALSLAAEEGELGIARRLLRGGADARATGKDGRTALEWAEAEGHEAVAQLLRGCFSHAQEERPTAMESLTALDSPGAVGVSQAAAPAQPQPQPQPRLPEGTPPRDASKLQAQLEQLQATRSLLQREGQETTALDADIDRKIAALATLAAGAEPEPQPLAMPAVPPSPMLGRDLASSLFC